MEHVIVLELSCWSEKNRAEQDRGPKRTHPQESKCIFFFEKLIVTRTEEDTGQDVDVDSMLMSMRRDCVHI